jgi:hypothetical protein
MSLCVPRCMDYALDYFWCSNSKNLYVPPMFHPMLYGVFHPISSMLPILHVKSISNVNTSLITVCMIIVNFLRFFYTASPKTDRISFVQNRSNKPAHRFSLSIRFKLFNYLNFIPIFNRFCLFSVKPTILIDQFSELCRFLKPCSLLVLVPVCT